jgi:hypothetical protein
MLAIEPLLKARLQSLSALTGWAVRVGSEHGDRKLVPAVDARCPGAAVADSKASAVALQPQWVLTLTVRRGADASAQIDAALAAVIEAMHNWAPGQAGGRGWEPLRLAAVTEPAFADEGLAGYELSFTTAARYLGQQ